ncbi:MAG TPA: BolA/IbaG family iron-sulfur metabolism protein [Patescibacteria group bacterium]|nr:BolA/IbaG family iron-sulfur metabolism protein [Patescibacteria group bacterium]
MDTASIKALIKRGIPEAKVEIEDVRGDGLHLAATVVCQRFAGKPLLEQHRMVHAALGSHIGETIHALQIKTRVA